MQKLSDLPADNHRPEPIIELVPTVPAEPPMVEAVEAIVPSTQPSDTIVVNADTQPSADFSLNTERALADLEVGLTAKHAGNLIEARTRLNLALHGGLPQEQVRSTRIELAELADKTVFSFGVAAADPLAEYYTVRSGDSLARIAHRYKLTDDLLATINRIPNKNIIREGMRLKVLHGPFHVSINKSNHMMHVYLQDVYVWSARVALGANGSTPTGVWQVIVRQENPQWVDPRTGQRWHPNDPDNPIGNFWIGLEGVKGDAVGQSGYGIHGTIEPETIGQDVSLGCVRLADDDIARVFTLLVPYESYVTIHD
ncbi:MAG: L,D-transpeptidase family protein [Phycisphaerales bacterium]|nr:L,D-transpeptidase family protein [Phycisphaerales bacterium]